MCALLIESAAQWFGTSRPVPPWLALLPVLPAVFFVVALSRAVQRMDELQKRICLESAFVAFMLTLVLGFVIGGLDRAGLYHAASDALGTPLLFFWACAYIVSVRRYR
jgi:hypothetical protein